MTDNEFLIDGTVVALTNHALERFGQRSVHELRELMVGLVKHGQRRLRTNGQTVISWREYRAVCVLEKSKIVVVTLVFSGTRRQLHHSKGWRKQARKLDRVSSERAM